MEFWLLAPEINSGRIWSGPGATTLQEAAAAWDALAAGLHHAATGYSAAILAIPWTGPSADSMRAAATRYAGWLTATAAHADSTATQARAAAAAYETARITTVHPTLVAANRTQLLALTASNLLGQNTPAIAALETQYGEYWAQDITAMADYQTNSAAATQLTPFSPPSQVTNLAANLQQLLLGGGTPGDLLNAYLEAFLSSAPYEIPISLLSMFNVLWAVAGPGSPITQALNQISAATIPAAPAVPAPAPIIAAGPGAAQQLGPLSVPRSWGAPLPAPRRVPTMRPTPPSQTEIPIPLPAPIPARGATPPKQQRPQPEYGAVVRFIARPPSGG